ncbi:MAG TPA: flagellar basal body-associated protein FliL [Verrucomicrobiae bacterium]|nr:flagellar basal body-associated protein FliL [Verrucomicrobiae bacterium]
MLSLRTEKFATLQTHSPRKAPQRGALQNVQRVRLQTLLQRGQASFRKDALWLALLLAGSASLAAALPQSTGPSALSDEKGLSGTTILIIRHAEKPVSGSGLATEGQARADAYVGYFRSLRLDSQPVHLDYLVAAEDSEHSLRSRLTLDPLARSLGLKPDTRFQSKRPQDLVRELKARSHGKVILICWHHHEIPQLLQDLGADPSRLLPEGEWPGQQFGWMLRLRYDEEGHLIRSQTKRIKEHLMPDDD